jgi:hypothetical protein
MDKREILQKIIDAGGQCEQLEYQYPGSICKSCPLSRLKQRRDGTYLSCWESIVVIDDNGQLNHGTEGYAEDLYLAKALEVLQDIIIEDMLSRGELADERTDP